MPSQTTANDRLDGWESISDYLGWTPRTAIRWEKLKGLPVHRVPGGKRQPVYAFKHEIDEWFGRTGGAESTLAHATVTLESTAIAESPAAPLPTRRIPRRAIYAAIVVAILLIAVLSISKRLSTQPVIQITDVTQLTNDGTAKQSLVTDGKRLYFSEMIGADEVLSSMAINGGPIRRITLPISNPSPVDISPDGKFLLVLSNGANEEEHPLWIVPTAGGPPLPINGAKSRAAAWSPSGEWIAFGFGDAIYLTSRSGDRTHLLSPVSGVPERIRWSANGNQLLFTLSSPPARTGSLWQLDLDSSFKSGHAAPTRTEGEPCCRAELLARDDGGYFMATKDMTPNRLLYLRGSQWLRTKSFEATVLSTPFGRIEWLAAAPDMQRLFVLSNSGMRGELVRYDPSRRTSTTFLLGASATYVDFAKSGGMVAYVDARDNTLWINRGDGSEARQLTAAGVSVQLPRWSPDGKSIAYMGKLPDRPWRIFVVPVSGGPPREASESDDNQGAPTWSSDGRFLSYGNVLCLPENDCAIHTIDLASGKTATLPDSQGLSTARWSPDGRHIAALNPVKNELSVFDLDHQKWRKLAEGINGNNVSWSSDSKYVYTKSSMSGNSEILRVAVGGGAAQTVLKLDSFSKGAGQLDNWFSLTPDNAIVLNRWLNTSEIYALNYSEK